ncbi:helix-turn-helix domain-containing protein [Gilvirhabdus luticola]
MGEYGKYLMKLPDVLSIINESIKLESIINSNVQSKLLIKGVETFYHWKYINKFTNGRKASEEFCFFLVLNALKFAVGPVFQITSICIPGYHHEVLKENLPAGSYKLILTENHYAIGFPTQMLNVSQANHRSELERPILPNGSYRSKITHLFGGMEEGVMPSLELLAMQSDISTRGLSRHLANEGTNFRELLNIYLLNKALFYLEHTNHSIEVISELLGYHHVSNFIRAFKNATTVSPLIFRSQLSSSGGK